MMSEQVLVVPTEIVAPYFKSELGFIATSDNHELYDLIRTSSYFTERTPVESDSSKKQLIPYIIVRFKDQIFVTERTTKQTEVRLHNKASIGLGGHINPVDFIVNEDVVLSGMLRELNEELFFSGINNTLFRGYIYDNTNAVGLVHLGLLYEVWLENSDARIREVDKMKGGWRLISELHQLSDRLETWSQIARAQIFDDEV